MSYPLAIGVCLLVLLLLGTWERLVRRRALGAVPIRIHVNGTRGKSTVTRLIWGALHEAGIPAVAKTTGTAARLVLPDGSEHAVRRVAPPSIREQLWLLRRARRAGARAVVAECMAITPELQMASERDMLAATIGVITNVRMDHTDVMGSTLDEIAESLANTTPAGGALVVGDPRFLPIFERRAARLGARVLVAVPPGEGPSVRANWEQGNHAVALAVARELGIPDPVALEGMRKARPDPGAFREAVASVGGREVRVVDATAANDPESLALLLESAQSCGNGAATSAAGESRSARLVTVYNHRDDRAARMRVFAADCPCMHDAIEVIVTGDRPSRSVMQLLRSRRGTRPGRFVPRARLRTVLDDVVRARPEVRGIVFCGNTRGLDVRTLFGADVDAGFHIPIGTPPRVE